VRVGVLFTIAETGAAQRAQTVQMSLSVMRSVLSGV